VFVEGSGLAQGEARAWLLAGGGKGGGGVGLGWGLLMGVRWGGGKYLAGDCTGGNSEVVEVLDCNLQACVVAAATAGCSEIVGVIDCAGQAKWHWGLS